MAAILAIAPANRAKLACRVWIGQVGSINKPGSLPQVGVFVTGIEDV
jgi:hypothetical protein